MNWKFYLKKNYQNYCIFERRLYYGLTGYRFWINNGNLILLIASKHLKPITPQAL